MHLSAHSVPVGGNYSVYAIVNQVRSGAFLAVASLRYLDLIRSLIVVRHFGFLFRFNDICEQDYWPNQCE